MTDTAGELKRYDVTAYHSVGRHHPHVERETDADGYWVKYEDVRALLESQAAELRLLRQDKERLDAGLRELRKASRVALWCMEEFLPSPDGPDPEHEDEHRAIEKARQYLRTALDTAREAADQREQGEG